MNGCGQTGGYLAGCGQVGVVSCYYVCSRHLRGLPCFVEYDRIRSYVDTSYTDTRSFTVSCELVMGFYYLHSLSLPLSLPLSPLFGVFRHLDVSILFISPFNRFLYGISTVSHQSLHLCLSLTQLHICPLSTLAQTFEQVVGESVRK